MSWDSEGFIWSSRGLIYERGLTLISAWISNHVSNNVRWHCIIEVWEWMSKCAPYLKSIHVYLAKPAPMTSHTLVNDLTFLKGDSLGMIYTKRWETHSWLGPLGSLLFVASSHHLSPFPIQIAFYLSFNRIHLVFWGCRLEYTLLRSIPNSGIWNRTCYCYFLSITVPDRSICCNDIHHTNDVSSFIKIG